MSEMNGKGASQTMHERVKLHTTNWHTNHYYHNNCKSYLSYISLSLHRTTQTMANIRLALLSNSTMQSSQHTVSI